MNKFTVNHNCIVVTTIQKPTNSIIQLARAATHHGFSFFIVGDRKTPCADWPENSFFFGIDDQVNSIFSLAHHLPENHYSRKNLGYLLASSHGAEVIFDTDDDNAPLSCWAPRNERVACSSYSRPGWVNAYRWFTQENIWPRGLPLEVIRNSDPIPCLEPAVSVRAPIQQGLANGSPDVDAVWRLILEKEITFENNGSVCLGEGTWCPFNSQSTWWLPEAYPLMYLPSFVSFRMTDIWRSLIAQRCLWPMGYGLVFVGPEMYQERNPHDLHRDFEQEIPGYLFNNNIREVLEDLSLLNGQIHVGTNLRQCYEALIAAELIPEKEMILVDAWLSDLCLSNVHL